MKSGSILVVDDDPGILDLLADFLGEHGWRIATARSGTEMRRCLEAETPELVVLDVKLPGEDGLGLIAQIRQRQPGLPVIMLTSLGTEVDRIVGLELGADDYLAKPFNPRELLARIRAVLRRAQPVAAAEAETPAGGGERLRFEGWSLDLGRRQLHAPDGEPVGLTHGEFKLLEAFLRAPNRVLSRDTLLEMTHLGEADVFDRTIDVLVLRLRRKIEPNPRQPTLIRTERGVGYVFAANVTRG